MSLKVGIVGATGAVGEELLRIFKERSFPVEELRLFASPASNGRIITAFGKDWTVRSVTPDGFGGLDYVFFSAGSSTARDYAPIATGAGARVIDNSSAFRMDEGVPLVIPEINAHTVTTDTNLAAVPNCSTIILLMGIAPLRELGCIRRVIVSTYQAASGAGAKAMQELVDQSREMLMGQSPTCNVFPHPIAFNLFSHDTAIDESGRNEEERKVAAETRKILEDDDIAVTATCVRVPVLRAHSQSVYLEFDSNVSDAAAREVLGRAEGITIVDDRENNHFPMPREASGKDTVLVGRIRGDMHNSKAINLFLSGDQLRKGAALDSIQIAELMERVNVKKGVRA